MKFFCLALALAAGLAGACGQELPVRGPREALEDEPKLILNDFPDPPAPEAPLAVAEGDVQQLTAALAAAVKNAASRERLFRAGVLAKVEAERARLRAVQLARDRAAAELRLAVRRVEAARAEAVDAEKLAVAVAALAGAKTAAEKEEATCKRAEQAAADLRAWRERKLLALGSGSRSHVRRAEAEAATAKDAR